MEIGEGRSFHKQPTVVLVKNKNNKNPTKRFTHAVGLGIKTPKDAKVGTYIDKKCPFAGNVAIAQVQTGSIFSQYFDVFRRFVSRTLSVDLYGTFSRFCDCRALHAGLYEQCP